MYLEPMGVSKNVLFTAQWVCENEEICKFQIPLQVLAPFGPQRPISENESQLREKTDTYKTILHEVF